MSLRGALSFCRVAPGLPCSDPWPPFPDLSVTRGTLLTHSPAGLVPVRRGTWTEGKCEGTLGAGGLGVRMVGLSLFLSGAPCHQFHVGVESGPLSDVCISRHLQRSDAGLEGRERIRRVGSDSTPKPPARTRQPPTWPLLRALFTISLLLALPTPCPGPCRALTGQVSGLGRP